MAGKKLGTVFVELGLDSTEFTKGEAKILQQSQSTSLKMEQNWRTLGSHSDLIFNAMKANITNAYDAIANKSTTSAAERMRAEEAMHQKIQALNDQQFGKQTSGLDILKGHYIAVTAAMAVAVGAVSKAWDMAKVGADFDEQSGILTNLGAKYDMTADQIVEAMDRASGYQVAKSELMKIALEGIGRGLNPKQLTDLADAAQILGDVTGGGTTEALNNLTQALESGRVKGLDQTGVTIDLGEAFGGLESKMTRAEKTQALYALTMQATTELQKQQTKEVDEGADKIARIEKKFDDATLAASRFMKELVVGAIDAFPGWNSEVGKAESASKAHAAALKAESDAAKNLLAPYQAQIDALKKQLQAREDDKKAIKENAAEAKRTADEARKAGQEYIDMKAAEKRKAYEFYTGVGKWQEEQAEKEKKFIRENTEYFLFTTDEEIKAIREKFSEGTKLTEKRGDYEREIYKDLRGYANQYYAAEETLIQGQAEKYRKAEVDKNAVAMWVADQHELLEIKKGKASDDFIGGVNAGILEMQRNTLTFGQAGYEIFKTFADSSKTALSTILFDSIKTGTFDAQAVWTSFSDSMLKKFTDTVSQMVTEAAIKDIAMMFKAEWTADSSNILGILNKGWDLWNSLTGDSGAEQLSGPGMEGLATGGALAANKPVWVGEKGPELLFSQQPGYVMEHNQSMAYASRNGGYIPGYANGGVIDPMSYGINPWVPQGDQGNALQFAALKAYLDRESTLSGFGVGIIPRFQDIYSDNALWIDSLGQLHDTRHATGYGWLGDIWSNVMHEVMPRLPYVAFGQLLSAGGFWAEVGNAVGTTATTATGAAGSAAGTAASSGAYEGIFDWSDLWDVALQYGTNELKEMAIKQILKIATNAIFGGGGSTSFSFQGASGDLSWLTEGMGAIAPKTDSFSFPVYHNGVDYVPKTGLALLEKGERVTAKENAARRSGGEAAQPIILNFTCPLNGKVVTQYLYDSSKAGKKVIHQRGITNV